MGKRGHGCAAKFLPLLLLVSGCRPSGLPKAGSGGYLDEVTAFYVGLAALQAGDDVRADSTLDRATQLAKGEPAAWANWGVLALRQGNYDAAAQRFNQAQQLLPDNGQILYLQGILASKRGNPGQAIAQLRRAVELDSKNLRALYLLAQEVERQGDANGEAEFQQLLSKILAVQAGNPAVLLELGRAAAKRGDGQTLHSVVATLSQLAPGWPAEVQPQWTALQGAAAAPDPRPAAIRIAFLRNSLMRVPAFRQSLSLIQPVAGSEAMPFQHFLLLPSPSATPPPADTALHFRSAVLATASHPSSWVGAFWLNGAGPATPVTANAQTVNLSTGATFPFPGGRQPLTPESILAIDFNYDFKTDLVLAGEGGLRFMRQESPTLFTDVTATTKLPSAVLHAAYSGAWALDVEADGDLDILLGAPGQPPTVLRNNGDGSFAVAHPFAGVTGLRGFAWVDLDGDGNPDAALIDSAGVLHCFHNQRSGVFRQLDLPADLPHIKAITVADNGRGGHLALVAVADAGTVISLSLAPESAVWTVTQLATVPSVAGDVRLLAADFDNNGAMDFVVAPAQGQARLLLGSGAQQFTLLPQPVDMAQVSAVVDLNGDGRLDLLGLSADGRPQQGLNEGEKQYRWQTLRPRAHVATGDQRVNSFGIGGRDRTARRPVAGPSIDHRTAIAFWPR